jgi:hypothetical protein
VLQAVLAHGAPVEMLAPIAAFLAQHETGPVLVRLAPEQRFVLSRALMGAVRAAVLEEQPFFKSRAFEDELVRLVLAYLQAVTLSAQRPSPLHKSERRLGVVVRLEHACTSAPIFTSCCGIAQQVAEHADVAGVGQLDQHDDVRAVSLSAGCTGCQGRSQL